MTWPINIQTPLTLDGWLEFNRYKWNVTPLRTRLSLEGKEVPSIEAVLYLDKKGRIVRPPLNPYLPVSFYSTPTQKSTKLYRQWIELSELLVQEFKRRGVKGAIPFPPEMIDIRQWQWHGFLGEVRYTFYLKLPHTIEVVDSSVQNKINKAIREGFTCEIATKANYEDVIACLVETEMRQRFNYMLNKNDLVMAIRLLSYENFRIYVCKSNSGEIACTRIVLSAPGLRAIDLVAGTKTRFLKSGCTQLLIWHVLNDLAQYGATGFDFVGANLPTVSAAKADWGGILTPYYMVHPINLRTFATLGLRLIKGVRR